MSNYVIEQILHKKKITDYLASKGIHPKGRESNGKLKYWCPIHQEKNSPSFIVYLNGEFENFYCYGCKAKYHIIHLYRDLEGFSGGAQHGSAVLGGGAELRLFVGNGLRAARGL
jgi:DNA primase